MKKQAVCVFCTNSSLRGVGKIYKSENPVIRALWLFFVIGMVILLLYSSIKILREYLEYNTTIQSRLIIDTPSHFPSLTICGHQQFSSRANAVWSRGVMSPANFSQMIRRIAKHYMNKNDIWSAEAIFIYDLIRMYYQNLDFATAVNISHDLADLLIYCVNFNRNGMFVGKVSDCGLHVIRFSSPDFFNCYTIMVKEDYAMATKSIRLVVGFPRPVFPDKFMRQSFLQEMFRNAFGGQLIIHERRSRPQTDRERIHVEPGKLIEITYKNVQWKEEDTPKDPCVSEASLMPDFNDLDNSFGYDYEHCLQFEMAKKMLAECNCVAAFLPRVVIPNATYPYCGHLGNGTQAERELFFDRLRCVHVQSKLESLNELRGETCMRRCSEQKFETHVSSTAWKPTEWQLNWLLRLSRAWSTLTEETFQGTPAYEKAEQTVGHYLDAKSLDELMGHTNDTLFGGDEGHYACIVLAREGNNTLYREERLGLSLYGLVSRIGGSGSLYLGLTCAFFIELIEFCLILKVSAQRRAENEQDRAVDGGFQDDGGADGYGSKQRRQKANSRTPTQPPERMGQVLDDAVWEWKSVLVNRTQDPDDRNNFTPRHTAL